MILQVPKPPKIFGPAALTLWPTAAVPISATGTANPAQSLEPAAAQVPPALLQEPQGK